MVPALDNCTRLLLKCTKGALEKHTLAIPSVICMLICRQSSSKCMCSIELSNNQGVGMTRALHYIFSPCRFLITSLEATIEGWEARTQLLQQCLVLIGLSTPPLVLFCTYSTPSCAITVVCCDSFIWPMVLSRVFSLGGTVLNIATYSSSVPISTP